MKNIVVTGAFGGMGRAVVDALANAGYRVFALDRVVPENEILPERVTPIACDVTSEESVSAAVATVKEQTDSLFAVLHFAGIYLLDSLVELPEARLNAAFQVNVLGVARVNRLFLPLLGRGSRILITTSELATLDPLPFTGVYAITKASLEKYAFSLRMEVQLLGIDVVVLRPGAVDTGMIDVSMRELDAFTNKTEIYTCNAKRFRQIVERVEARKIPPIKLAKKVKNILAKRYPRYAYAINRNPLLVLMHLLPKRWQTTIIKWILQ